MAEKTKCYYLSKEMFCEKWKVPCIKVIGCYRKEIVKFEIVIEELKTERDIFKADANGLFNRVRELEKENEELRNILGNTIGG